MAKQRKSESPFVELDVRSYRRVPFSVFCEDVVNKACPECGAKDGQLHILGCSLENCPRCAKRLNNCGC